MTRSEPAVGHPEVNHLDRSDQYPAFLVRSRNPAELIERVVAGDKTALARLLSAVEQGGAPARLAGKLAYPLGGRAYTVGITGAPGSGKSTLTDRLIGRARAADETVAVLAIDPSSPFSGGAILGDRVRMSDHFLDPGVFIRSMATRGHLGGLALAAPAAVRVLDAAGFPWVLVETVGVGQVEVEIAGAADTTLVVVNPGWGDSVQANKAGLLEIADIFVINKSDRAGAQQTENDLMGMLELSGIAEQAWRPPILRTVAADGTGTAELWETIAAHRKFVTADGSLAVKRTQRLRTELRQIVTHQLELRAYELCRGPDFEALAEQVLTRSIDPDTAAERIVAGAGAGAGAAAAAPT